ncbi:MAG: GNAT family N-acetyltransferase, partial [Chromatiales bacterium]|nr:GNAT family N-acetyltransferase [Chromatiales bacterium]
MPDSIHTRLIPESEFLQMADAWQDLLDRSSADPLFMSWPWLSAWWETWSGKLQLELYLIGVYAGPQLIALAPFYRHRHRLPFAGGLTHLQLLGNALRIAPTVRTEYSSFLVDHARSTPAVRALTRVLAASEWDVITVSDMSTDFSVLLDGIAGDLQTIAGARSTDRGTRIDTSRSFQDWLSGLGPNTRLRAYNRRSYVERNGHTITRETLDDHDAMIAQLNNFHRERWGAPCFPADAIAFHRRLQDRLSPAQQARSTALLIDGQVCSVLYDLQAGQTIYNLQSGFLEHYDSKLSLGTLHLGFSIESAYADHGVHHYDLLAGGGKKHYYKSRLNGMDTHFITASYCRTRRA